ncbi:MAG TPA: DUF2799 domain-containing protein [Brevundimonas sp.]|nr:DUF2799 domain-containing protein [Brevundimonas sp.]
MNRLMAGMIVAAGALLAGSCATMSEDQCRVADWGGQGLRDGSAGLPMSRLDDHAKACAKHGVAPDLTPYRSAREDGLRSYCRLERGFEEGRRGRGYHGVCRAEEEAEFLPAFHDGSRLHAAESALESASSELNSAVAWIEDREDKLQAKQRELGEEGKTDAERVRIRERIQEVRGELREARRRARDAERALEWARVEADRVRFDLLGRYPV